MSREEKFGNHESLFLSENVKGDSVIGELWGVKSNVGYL